ncbi:hypothetical protein AB0L13_38835 [Saccharopolyspora shandongensis]|uniref:hypothetical protein n=1 Tax=Saccharopolyspora shandongensis TaxID=418495 RepID=UPI003449B997
MAIGIGIGTAVWIASGVSGCDTAPVLSFTEQGQLSAGAATDTFDVPHGFEVLMIQGAAPTGSAPCVLLRTEEFPQRPQ